MKKFLKLTCAIALTFTMLTGMSTMLYAEDTSDATLTWLQEQYIWVNNTPEGNDYYLSANNSGIGEEGVIAIDDNGDGVDDVTGLELDKMYSSAEFEDPYAAEPTDILYTGTLLATYELESAALPSEMTFEVYGQGGSIKEETIDTSAGKIKLSYDYKIMDNNGEGVYYDTSLYVWNGNVAYEIVDSSFVYNGTKSTWVVPYSANGSDYVVTFDKNSGESIPVNIVIDDVTLTTPAPPTGEGDSNEDTKVVNGPSGANAAMVIVASGTTAVAAFATISKRRK